jgi:hypothetical protein
LILEKEKMSPASTSGGSHGDNGSLTSRRNGTNYRYRTLNAQSEVDETLFGAPHRLETAAKMRAERQLNHENTTKQVEPVKKQFVRHITKDLIRDIL